MSNLIVLAFPNKDGAIAMRDRLIELQKEHLIALDDAAVVIRDGDGKPKVKQLNSLVGAGALGGAFWGMLIGLLFLAPWLGMAFGALGGAIGGKFADVGIDDDFIKQVGDTIEPNTSALFLLVREATGDRVLEEVKDYDATVLQTSLSTEDEARLREAFGSEEHDEVDAA